MNKIDMPVLNVKMVPVEKIKVIVITQIMSLDLKWSF